VIVLILRAADGGARDDGDRHRTDS
jgi:hypothetical protein